MKCKRFRIEDLRNEEWFQFYTEFKTLVEQHNPGALNIEALFATFLSLYAGADEAIELIRKSATTEQLAEADHARDIVFRGFADAVKAGLNHFDPIRREAARRLKIVFDHYGNIARKSYDEETASIYNFIQEIRTSYAAEIQTLEVYDWVNILEADNKTFDALKQTRYTEGAGKTGLRMANIRRETNNTWRDMLDRIDASMLLNGEAPYAPFVNALNIRTDHYIDILAQRKGRAAKKKDDTGKPE
ncbi:MAG: DUF6261 family protein [Tannerella sp.]|jgi:hypothetical protein|nr:DUF6261 family protein [Tannerella sp.]